VAGFGWVTPQPGYVDAGAGTVSAVDDRTCRSGRRLLLPLRTVDIVDDDADCFA
jgi:hypothetical protein